MRKYTLYAIIATLIIVIDQLSKAWIVNHMTLYESIPVIGDFFMITSHRNRGAAFGILQGQRTFFIMVTIVILIALIWFINVLTREGKRLFPIALSFIFGGAVGNFIDRLRMGEVVDFFHFHFQFSLFGFEIDYHYPIFNIADSAIVCGVILILIDTVLSWRNERKGGLQSNETESA